ncbi:MAG: hypothetical protein ABEJ61_05510 [Haloferacaceae archaeon]
MSGTDETGPTAVRSIAVSADDVVAALEARTRTGRRAVLRVTPPFSGRMRARIHVERDASGPDVEREGTSASGGADGPAPIHLPPERLVADPPAYPDPDETADALRERGSYSTEAHHDRHVRRVEAWRRAVRASIVESVTVDTAGGSHEIAVKVLDQRDR